MRKLFSAAICAIIFLSCNNNKTDSTAAAGDSKDSTAQKTQAASEFADARYVDIGKKALGQFAAGDVDGWMSGYADNAVHIWSAGDSLAGKKAIADYWKERRTNVIDSIAFVNDIWLPLKVNQPQRGPDIPGVWLLSWYQVNVKYKNGQKLSFWVHADHHFNDQDKIDRTIQYIDRAPIQAALAKK